MQTKFVVTGTGRSGTAYIAKLFQENGYKVGHQSVFRHDNALGRPVDWGEYEGDCSYAFVGCKQRGVKVVLVKRDKQKVTDSWLRLGAFTDHMHETHILWSIVLDRDFPEILSQDSPVKRASLYYDLWNEKAEKIADRVFQLETMKHEQLFEAVGREYEPVSVPTNFNHDLSDDKQLQYL